MAAVQSPSCRIPGRAGVRGCRGWEPPQGEVGRIEAADLAGAQGFFFAEVVVSRIDGSRRIEVGGQMPHQSPSPCHSLIGDRRTWETPGEEKLRCILRRQLTETN